MALLLYGAGVKPKLICSLRDLFMFNLNENKRERDCVRAETYTLGRQEKGKFQLQEVGTFAEL